MLVLDEARQASALGFEDVGAWRAAERDCPCSVVLAHERYLVLSACERDPGAPVDGSDRVDGSGVQELCERLIVERILRGCVFVRRVDDLHRPCALGPCGVQQAPHVDIGRAHDSGELCAALAFRKQPFEPAGCGLRRRHRRVERERRREWHCVRGVCVAGRVLELEIGEAESPDLAHVSSVQSYFPDLVKAWGHWCFPVGLPGGWARWQVGATSGCNARFFLARA